MKGLSAGAGKIGINEKWQWALEDVELKEREMLDLQIGGHWIAGMLFKYKDELLWSSWLDGVPVSITYGLKARWPDKA